MSNPWPIAPLTDKDLNFAVVNYDFTSFTADAEAELPSLLDSIDLTILDFATSIADQGPLIIDIFSGLDDLANIPGEIDASDNFGPTLSDLASSAAAGDASLNDFNAFFVPPPPSGGGGDGTPTPTQSAKCGTHGQSTILLSDSTGDCFAANVLPVLDMADGPCYSQCVMDGSCFAGKTTVTGIALETGDAQLWSASFDTVTPQGTSTPVSRVTFKLTPYKTGHFLAKFTVNTSRNPSGEIWCLIVDVTNSGTAVGGGGGGGTSGGGGTKGGL